MTFTLLFQRLLCQRHGWRCLTVMESEAQAGFMGATPWAARVVGGVEWTCSVGLQIWALNQEAPCPRAWGWDSSGPHSQGAPSPRGAPDVRTSS